MSALVSGYESSDDERSAPGPSTSLGRLPTLRDRSAEQDEAEDDDDRLEAQARADAFGLSETRAEEIRRTEAKAVVKAAPDVLKEVRLASDWD